MLGLLPEGRNRSVQVSSTWSMTHGCVLSQYRVQGCDQVAGKSEGKS